MKTLSFRLVIILLNPDKKIDENRDIIDVGIHDQTSDLNTNLSSSRPEPSTDDKRNENSKNEQYSETKIVYGTTAIMEISNAVLSNCRSNYDVYCDKNGLAFMIAISPYKEEYAKLKRNNVRIRLITEITAENLKYCKEVVNLLCADVKHVEGVQGNFVISDNKIYLGTTTLEENKPIPDLVYSNAKGITEQNRFLFETLWKRATPAEQRITEIEENLLPVETRILTANEEIISHLLEFTEKTTVGVSVCALISAFQVIDNFKPMLESYKHLIKMHKQGKIKNGVRFLTHIGNSKQQVAIVKKYLETGFYIRHLNNLPALSFGVSEKQFVSTIEKMIDGKMIQSVLHSTEPFYIQHFQSLFEDLWNSSITAEKRISQVEIDISSEHTEVIENPVKTKQYFTDLVRNAKEEIMIVFPSSNALKRQASIGMVDLIKQKSAENVKIKILFPTFKNKREFLLLKYFYDKDHYMKNVNVREIIDQDNLKSSIVLVDRKYVLATELVDDSKELIEEAIGLATYSTSKPTILSYLSIFDGLWKQTEMSDNLRVANEKLVQNEEIEKEFINTAAHELRTPTQAIMGYTELDKGLLDNMLKNPKIYRDEGLNRDIIQLHNHYDTISRNASRLNQLINNLLDVAKIESSAVNSLQLHKEKLNLVKEINECLETQLYQKLKTKNIKVNFINQILEEQQCWVYADSSRLNQILTNLMDNAIKFSPVNGIIDIIIKNTDYDFLDENGTDLNKSKNNSISSQILIGISDMGKGISPKIMPSVFEKFVTDSERGTGLGLFITRNLVEGHGGKIWAFNNNDGSGSTFVFSLPKLDSTVLDNN